MSDLLSALGLMSIGIVPGAILGYLCRLLLEHWFRKDLENHKHTLAIFAQRLDFLHQERGKACLQLVRLLKSAKMHLKLLVDPMQLGPVDQYKACSDAHAACTELHNFIADSSFLFPPPLEAQMLNSRKSLWSILDRATLALNEAKRKDRSPFDDPGFRELWKGLRADFEPLEHALIAELRALLGSDPAASTVGS